MTQTRTAPSPLGDDMLHGAGPIAAFIGTTERRVYHLTDKKLIPVFRIGARLTARKSTLRAWIERQEADALGGGNDLPPAA